MTVVGFNFTKILVQRKDFVKGKINISNNVAIKKVDTADLALGASNQSGLKIDFAFNTKYEPDLGLIEMEGNVLYMADEKKTKEIIDNWKKTTRIPKDIMETVLNTVLQRCNVEALLMSRELNLPPPIPLPKVGAQTQVAEPPAPSARASPVKKEETKK